MATCSLTQSSTGALSFSLIVAGQQGKARGRPGDRDTANSPDDVDGRGRIHSFHRGHSSEGEDRSMRSLFWFIAPLPLSTDSVSASLWFSEFFPDTLLMGGFAQGQGQNSVS